MDNYIKENRGGIRVQAPICDRQIVSELSADFSLPDYQPEIKRLLRVSATVMPADRYIGAGNAEFSGTVDYNVLYAGNDGALYCTTQTGEYQFTCPVEMTSDFELNEGITCDVDTVTDTVVGRVAAPRRLSFKCRLRSRVRLYGTKVLEESVTGADAASVQRLCGQASCARVFIGNGEPLQLGDEILCDAQAGDLRVISSEARVFVSEAVAGSGVVNCRGEVCLKLLCCRENADEPLTVQLRRIPFSQAVPTDGAEVNCDACADGVCSDIRVTVEEGRILCEVSARLRTRAQRNEEVSFTRDVYSTASEGESRYLHCVFPHAVKCINGNFSLNTTVPLEEAGIRAGMRVVDVSLIPSVTSLENEHGKYRLVGRTRCQVILSDGEETSAQELELPFRYECDGESTPVSDYDATVDVIGCRARVDGERIGVDAELSVSLATRGDTTFEMLSEATFGEAVVRQGAVYTVCYPSRDDTLWSVAKRYHRAVSVIADVNSLAGAPAADSPESLSGVRYLLV